MNGLDQMIGNADPIVAQTAKLLDKATDDFKVNKLSQSEYQEIVKDLLDLDKVAHLTSDLNRRQAVYDAYQEIKAIISLIAPLL